jgi:hypothetical protein
LGKIKSPRPEDGARIIFEVAQLQLVCASDVVGWVQLNLLNLSAFEQQPQGLAQKPEWKLGLLHQAICVVVDLLDCFFNAFCAHDNLLIGLLWFLRLLENITGYSGFV